ncbi:hypothetical protein J3R30DRAFT_3421907 [Lentinula aciculospora]|uniref:Uncharacterized protein n=1 Tax=Lentinula aciculospora TaxID=153920 RepID=A0A9W9AV74_9AGAR|nr:hypothetical protein J3R30DRAFT_3421907 [Lentinula aciculospora]
MASDYLDPLTLLTLLLPSADPATDALLDLIKEKCSSKELIIACEENLERVHRMVVLDEEEDGEESENDSEPEEGRKKKDVPIGVQILRLVRMFSVISNIPFRRKSASDTVQLFIPELESTIRTLGSKHRFSKSIGRDVLWYSMVLVDRIMEWVEKKVNVKKVDVEACKDVLCPFISSLIDSLSYCIEASLAKRAFKQCFSKLGVRETLDEGYERGKEVIEKAIESYNGTGGSLLPASPKSAFVFFAHTLLESQNTPTILDLYFPITLASIQSNILLDEALAVLLLSFSSPRLSSQSEISPESILIPLLTILPSLASAHPDPFIRHCTFRVLGLVLSVSPVPLQMQVLKDLVGRERAGDSNIVGQMRVAAVGLVKDAVLRALTEVDSNRAGGENMFASPRFLQTFASVLFSPDPPDVFNETQMKVPSVKDLEEDRMNTELLRLAEVLSLYYVLDMRDVKNRTGIRDRDNRANIERTLLTPMRRAVPIWIEAVQAELEKTPLAMEVNKNQNKKLEAEVGNGKEKVGPEPNARPFPTLIHESTHDSAHAHISSSHALVPLISLQMGLERIDDMWRRKYV